MMVHTTFKQLKSVEACQDSYDALRHFLFKFKDDDPIDIVTILDISGPQCALCVPDEILSGDNIDWRYRLFTTACCKDMAEFLVTPESRKVVEIAKLCARGEIGWKELADVCNRAWDEWESAWSVACNAALDYAGIKAYSALLSIAWDNPDIATRDIIWYKSWNDAWANIAEHFRLIFSTEL